MGSRGLQRVTSHRSLGPSEEPFALRADDPATAANQAAWRALARWERPFLCAFGDRDPITAAMAPILQRTVPGAAGLDHRELTARSLLALPEGARAYWIRTDSSAHAREMVARSTGSAAAPSSDGLLRPTSATPWWSALKRRNTMPPGTMVAG